MNNALEFDIKAPDLKRLERVYAQLGSDEKENIIQGAFERAVKPTVILAQAYVNEKTGNLSRSIGSGPLRGGLGVSVGARIFGPYRGYHAHLVESGTKDRGYVSTKRCVFKSPSSGKWITVVPGRNIYTGWMVGSHFMERAVKETNPYIMRKVGDEFYRAIDDIHRKNGL